MIKQGQYSMADGSINPGYTDFIGIGGKTGLEQKTGRVSSIG